jgi:hypothetical protein
LNDQIKQMEKEKDNSTLTNRKSKLSLVIEKEPTVEVMSMSSPIIIQNENKDLLNQIQEL